MMNIFLDTSVLYKDPLWMGNFFTELKKIIKDKDVNCFVSEIVLKELRHNYKKIIEEARTKLNSFTSHVEKYNIAISEQSIIDTEESLARFDACYSQLKHGNIISILEFSNDFLPDIVDRAIERLKPFTEKKTELKDCIIWMTYYRYAEANKSDNCILLTANTTDFCDPNDSSKIHPDLQKDSGKFKVYTSPKDLIQGEKDALQSVSTRFQLWLDDHDLSDESILEMLRDNFNNEITRKVERGYDRLEPYELIDADYFMTGYVSPGPIDILEVENVETAVFENELIVSGDVVVSTNVEIYEYNSARDPGEDTHLYRGEIDNTVRLSFSFYYDQKEKPRNLNLDNFEIEKN